MRIAFTGDWHLDMANLAYTVPAIEAGIEAARSVDLFIHGGDLVVNRSNVHPHVAYTVRRLIESGTGKAECGAIVIAGNHDQSFHADRVGMVEGIMGDGSLEYGNTIRLATTPRTFNIPIRTGSPFKVAFVCVPTPNKYWARAKMEEGVDVAALLQTMVQGMIGSARARPLVTRVVVVYHGNVAGAALSDERLMPSGVDITMPTTAFAGADIVLAGHIHNRQEIDATAAGPRILYCGAPAPLTWNDQKLKPGMWLVDIDDANVDVTLVPLPVVSQMLHFDVTADAGDNVNAIVTERVNASAGAGDRVRVCVHATAGVLDGLDNKLDRALADSLALTSCKITTERTDSAVARMEMSTSTSILDAVERWAAMKMVEGRALESLIAMATEIESTVSDKHLDASYEMDPRVLTVENWCQYEEASIDFTNRRGLVVIEGPNYSGKSNISRAILFALFKKQVSGNRLADLIRKGTDLMRVTFDFVSRERLYRIIREVKRTSAGATAALHFMEIVDGSALPLAEGNARETQDAIEKLVGPLDLFLATSFAGQNEVDSLLDLSPGDMKDLLMQILQRDFASRLKAGTAFRSAAEGEAKRARDQVAALETSLAARAVDPAALGNLQLTLSVRRDEQSESERALADAMERKAAAAGKQLGLEAVAAEAFRAVGVLRAAEDRQRQLLDRLTKIHDQQAALDVVIARGLPEKRLAPAEIEAEMAALAGQEEAATRALRDALAEARRVAKDLQAAAQEASRAAQSATRTADRTRRDLLEAERQAALVDQVPCEGRVVEFMPTCGDAQDARDCGSCRFLTDATAARDGLADLTRANDLAVLAVDEFGGAALDAAGAVAVAENSAAVIEQQIADAADDAASRRTEVSFRLSAAVASERAAREYHDSVARKTQLEDDRQQIGQDLAPLTAEIMALRTKAASLNEDSQAARNNQIEIDAAATSVTRLSGTVDAGRRAIETTTSEIAAIEARAEDVARDQDRVAGLRAEAEKADSAAAVAALYCDAVHRDGIPFLLLEQFSIPMLQAVTNEYLKNTNLSVQIESERELQTGESRNAVEITFSDHRGRHPVSVASGAQRSSIGSALRHGMAELLARGTGSRIWLAVQDEGFGTLDPDNLEIAKTTLRNIAERRGLFVVISHVPGMSEVADHVLRVVDDGGTSRVEGTE